MFKKKTRNFIKENILEASSNLVPIPSGKFYILYLARPRITFFIYIFTIFLIILCRLVDNVMISIYMFFIEQVVGVCTEELQAAQQWNGPAVITLLRQIPEYVNIETVLFKHSSHFS